MMLIIIKILVGSVERVSEHWRDQWNNNNEWTKNANCEIDYSQNRDTYATNILISLNKFVSASARHQQQMHTTNEIKLNIN